MLCLIFFKDLIFPFRLKAAHLLLLQKLPGAFIGVPGVSCLNLNSFVFPAGSLCVIHTKLLNLPEHPKVTILFLSILLPYTGLLSNPPHTLLFFFFF